MTNATAKITHLPYMGIPKGIPKGIAPKRVVQPSQEIPFSALHTHELEQVESRLNTNTDPYEILAGKIEHLAELLGCSEARAERILFARLK